MDNFKENKVYNKFFVEYKYDKFVFHITSKSVEKVILKDGFKTGHNLNISEKRKAVFFSDLDVNYGIYARNKEGELYSGEEIGKVGVNIKGLKLLNLTYQNKKGQFENHIKYRHFNVKGELDKIPFNVQGTISYLEDGKIYEVVLKKNVANSLLEKN